MANKKTLYAYYVDACLGFPNLKGHEFLRLTYHDRLRLAGVKIKIKNIPVRCPQLVHHPVGQTLVLPVVPQEIFSEFRKDDIYLVGSDGDYYPIFPFEIVLVYPDEQTKAADTSRAA